MRELENARTQAERDPALQPCVAELERHLREWRERLAEWAGFEEARKTGWMIGRSVGIPIQRARAMQRYFDIPWNLSVFRLFESKAVRGALRADLHAAIMDVLRAQADWLARGMRAALSGNLAEAQAIFHGTMAGDEVPEPTHAPVGGDDESERVRAAVAALQAFVDDAKRAGNSEAQSNRAKKGRKDTSGGRGPDIMEQKDHMEELRTRYPNDRAAAMKEFCEWWRWGDKSPGLAYARKVACRIGWHGRKGRPKKTHGRLGAFDP